MTPMGRRHWKLPCWIFPSQINPRKKPLNHQVSQQIISSKMAGGIGKSFKNHWKLRLFPAILDNPQEFREQLHFLFAYGLSRVDFWRSWLHLGRCAVGMSHLNHGSKQIGHLGHMLAIYGVIWWWRHPPLAHFLTRYNEKIYEAQGSTPFPTTAGLSELMMLMIPVVCTCHKENFNLKPWKTHGFCSEKDPWHWTHWTIETRWIPRFPVAHRAISDCTSSITCGAMISRENIAMAIVQIVQRDPGPSMYSSHHSTSILAYYICTYPSQQPSYFTATIDQRPLPEGLYEHVGSRHACRST